MTRKTGKVIQIYGEPRPVKIRNGGEIYKLKIQYETVEGLRVNDLTFFDMESALAVVVGSEVYIR